MPESLSLERLQQDVAAILDVDAASVGVDDNLADHGLDSMRLMELVQRWSAAGATISFADLAERPQLSYWWQVISAAGGGPEQ